MNQSKGNTMKRQSQTAYAIYLRKSRADLEAESVEKFDTLKKHKAILMDLAVKNEYHVTDIYSELVSGDTIEGRPEMQRLLSAVRDGQYCGVLVTEISRLARGNSLDQGIVSEAFSSSGTLIITPRKIYDPRSDSDQDFFDFELFMARQEFKYIRRRLRAGKIQSQKTGQYLSSYPPFGYDKQIIDRKKTIVPNEHADDFRKISQYWIDGHSLRDCAYLYESLTGEKASLHKIQYMLQSPVYIGESIIGIREHGFDLDYSVHGIWEPIITEEQYQKQIERFTITTARVKKDKELRDCLAGLLFCQKCGKRVKRDFYRGHAQYRHDSFDRHSCSCKCASEKIIFGLLKDALSDKLHHLSVESESDPVQIVDYTEQIESARNQLHAIYDRYEKEIYTDEEFIQRRDEIKSRITYLEKLQSEEMKKKETISTETLKATLPQLIDLIGDPSVPVKYMNEFLRTFIAKIEYFRDDQIHLNIVFR